jgi:hypothetical protein
VEAVDLALISKEQKLDSSLRWNDSQEKSFHSLRERVTFFAGAKKVTKESTLLFAMGSVRRRHIPVPASNRGILLAGYCRRILFNSKA